MASENSGRSRTSSFDAFLLDSTGVSIKRNNDKNKGTKSGAAKSGRRSGKVVSSGQDQLSSYPFQSLDHRLKDSDKFLFDHFKKSKNDDDLVHRFHNWEPLHRQTSAVENFNRNYKYDDGSGDDGGGGKHFSGPGLTDIASGVGADEVNSTGVVGGLGGREESLDHKETIGNFHSFSHGSNSEQKTFVLGVPDSTSTVTTENAKEFRADSIDGGFIPAMSSSYALKNSGDRASDDLVATGRPISGHRSIGTRESLDIRQTPSVFESNAVGRVKVDSESREMDRVKTSSFVEQSTPCEFSGATSPAFYGAADESIDNQAATNEVHSREGISRTTSCEDLTLKRDKSLHSLDRSSSTVNHMFQFGADKGASKGHHTRKKKERKNVQSSNIDSIVYRAYHTGGKLSESSRCMESATENASVNYDNMPDLEKFSVLWGSPSHPRYPRQYNLHQCDKETESKEPWAADANLRTDSDQLTNADNFYNRESPIGGEQQHRWSGKDEGECGIPAKSNIWKSSSFDKQMPNPSSENDLLNSPAEKVKTNKCDNSIDSSSAARVSGRNHRSRFASRSSARQSSSASGAAKKYYQPRVEGNAKYRASDGTFESSLFASQPFVFQTDASQGCASGFKGNLSTEQIIEKDRIIIGAYDRLLDSSSVPQSISVLPKPSAQCELLALPVAVKSAESEQACESWRLRGNQAYAEGDFSKAEEYYTQGISCILPSEKSESDIRASVLCYSNRAATRMAVGRFRDALSDCMQAMDIDPNFVKVRLRAASCHLALGECKLALRYFKYCSRHLNELETIDLKLASEASEGIRKAQQVDDKTDEAVNLLSAKNSEGVLRALHLVNEALSICPYSEKWLELKAQALLSLCKYEEVIQACEEGLASVDWNHYCGKNGSENQMVNEEVYGGQCNCPIKLSFWQMTGKAKFYLGRLEEALGSLLKHEEAIAAAVMYYKGRMESLAPLIATIRNLLHHKAAGNEAFQAGKYAAAEEHYTAALACNNASRPFTSVCFCNRAAASHAQGHIADAIADCNRAMDLNPEYPKAISRRANLHEIIRNYGQAISDLRRLITLQESQQQKGKGGVRRLGNSSSNAQDLKEAYERLAKAEEDMKKGNPLDYYLILGVEPSSTAAEIKKSYRKAALKHHPDKAGQFLVRSDAGNDGLLKECEEEIRKDAQKLFQMIGEAYAILSDPSKRLRYDSEEELRKLQTTSTSKAETESESHGYQYEKGSRGHQEGWDAWKDYENQYRCWPYGSDVSEKHTYTRQDSKNSSDRFRRNDYDWDNI